MRKPKFLSPSSLGRFEENRDEFYLTYLCENRPPKIPQTPPMSVGSAFDAYCKSELYWRAFARRDEKYTFDYLFTRSVEPHNRDFAVDAGKYIFDSYVQSGAFAALDALLQESDRPPQFEFEIEQVIDGVPLLGKPDCRFFHKCGVHVIFDWKVNGYCSKYPTSPCKYYSLVADGWTADRAKPSRGAGNPHPEYRAVDHRGLTIHEGFLEESNIEWADQLSTYAWMLGEPVGDENVVMAVHQIVAKPVADQQPLLRVAAFSARVSGAWQRGLSQRYQAAWKAIENNHIFTDLTVEESRERCELLDAQASAITQDTPEGRYFLEVTR